MASNPDYQALFDEIAAVDPDVVVLVEYRQPRVLYVRAAPVMQQYPYGTHLKHRHGGDVDVFSRLPIRRFQVITSQTRTCIAADIVLGHESLRYSVCIVRGR